MGICESSKEKEKEMEKEKMQSQNTSSNNINSNKKEAKNSSNNDDDNLNGLETHPSSNSQENEIKHPELAKYDKDCKKSELSYRNGKIISAFSSQTEEEVIISGEVNKEIINKENDFNNKDFKNLVEKNGGIVIKDIDKKSNVLSYQGINPSLDIGKISEIRSIHTFNNGIKNGNNLNLIGNKNLNNNNIDKLRMSTKINVSFHDNAIGNDAFINIPKIDEPILDTDDFSAESPILLRSSLISK